jgi:hypothetical protein
VGWLGNATGGFGAEKPAPNSSKKVTERKPKDWLTRETLNVLGILSPAKINVNSHMRSIAVFARGDLDAAFISIASSHG